jgi:hypothetical protein
MDQTPVKTPWQYKRPFAAKITRLGETQGIPGQIVLFEEKGVLLRLVQAGFFKVSETVEIKCKLPLTSFDLKIKAKVVKTYDRVESVRDQEVQKGYITELHFIELTQEIYSAFSQFKRAASVASSVVKK